MEDSLFFIGLIGNVISVLVFGSPIPTFWRIVKNGSTEEFDPLPYVTAFLSASLWAYYGILKPNGLLVTTVNGVGVVLEALYISLYTYFAPPPLKVKAGILVAVLDIGFIGVVIGLTRLAMKGDMRLMVIGVICSGLSLLMYGSPLAVMKMVIRTKSVKYMPFFLSFFLMLNGGIWTLYALLDWDFFLGISNGIGFILGIIQLILYIIYMNPKVPKHLNIAVEEDSQLHQRLIFPNIDAHRSTDDEERGTSSNE
ncbi:hypothetical protein IEQ34_008784 [Dendrobium chrysotoxum]|uniref:Bidirectional sugar transporter SWEET n=1 Tax=Dendrobium chrysotoxum TaxID=161865 RepID=A0AAV7H0I3_DENCH|nr:hypothetical protein IEQ34_008784 [Dendrobium chrysotoxum]